MTFADCVSWSDLRTAPNWPKFRKTAMKSQIFWHDVIVKLFWGCFVSLVKFSYLSKFRVSTITGSGIMKIFFYKRLTKNPEIGNTPVWVLTLEKNCWIFITYMCIKSKINYAKKKKRFYLKIRPSNCLMCIG